MEDIDELKVGQRVQLDGEQGAIVRIDHDENVVWCAVKVGDGEAIIDVSPDEPWFEAIK